MKDSLLKLIEKILYAIVDYILGLLDNKEESNEEKEVTDKKVVGKDKQFNTIPRDKKKEIENISVESLEGEVTKYAICVHRNGAKVYRLCYFESEVLGKAYEGERYPIKDGSVEEIDGRVYCLIDLRLFKQFNDEEFGYIWATPIRWKIE